MIYPVKFTIHFNPASNYVEIYARASDTKYMVYPHEIRSAEPGTEIEPYLKLDRFIYEAFMREALGPTPTDDVLRDTRQVRDRMLTMVEKLVDEHVGG